MRILLINTNPAVSRLAKLSIEKLGYNFDEVGSFEEVLLADYDIIFIDSDCFDDEKSSSLKESNITNNIVYLAKRGDEQPSSVDFMLAKPFLPTDFMELVEKIGTQKSTHDSENYDATDSLEDLETPQIQEFEPEEEIGLDLEEFGTQEDSEDLQAHSKEGLELDDLGIDDVIISQSEFENAHSLNEEDDLLPAHVLDSDEIDEVKHLLDFEDVDEQELQEDTKETEKIEEIDFKLEDDVQDENLEDEQLDLSLVNLHLDEQQDAQDLDIDDLEFQEDAEDEDEALHVEDEYKIDALDTMVDISKEEELDDDAPLHVDTPNEEEKEEETTFDAFEEQFNAIEVSDEDKALLEEDVAEELFETPLEIQEDFSDASLENLETTLENFTQANEQPASEIASLDDLKEDDILKAFGLQGQDTLAKPQDDIGADLQEIISQSVSHGLQESKYKDALKGMKLNISITFDEL
ncbi:MAG: hypothetical protein IBX44_03815 [Sulfurospirillum sp.]|nr:hypothetical protein [Sulfurospirillum sp.]